MSKIAITFTDSILQNKAETLAEHLKIPLVSINDSRYRCLLVVTQKHLELRLTGNQTPGPVYVDFLKGKLAHRFKFGGGRGQLIAKAVGLQRKRNPTVVDVTAGLGRDAFVLTTLGCDVVMIERSPIIAALLLDGLQRAQQQAWFKSLKLKLEQYDAKVYLKNLNETKLPDVIYLDPMFPGPKKSALVKKEMRILREVVGSDEDAPELLRLALQYAKHRVVVKRARLAPTIKGPVPDVVFKGKSSRFDVYLKKQ